MRSSPLLAAILCFARWMSVVHAIPGPRRSYCCLEWSTETIPSDQIVNYFIQTKRGCPITAVLFLTVEGSVICSRPHHAWVKEAMRKVHEEKKKKVLQEQGQNEDGSTSNTTPAAPTKKLTTEERQKWKETEAEEIQEREEEAEEMSHGPVGNCCCSQWSTTRVPLQQIVNYTIQSEDVCPIKATLLKTTQGKTLCSDPDSDWVIEAVRKVDEETKKKALQEQGQNEDGTTSNTTPAAPTKKLTTEERQKWKETEAEEIQEREEEAEEMCKNSPQSTNTPPPRVLMYCINKKEP